VKETHQGFLSRSIKKQIFALQKSQAERAGAFGGGNRNPPFLKWRSLVTFFRQGKKVTRGDLIREQKRTARRRFFFT